MSDQTEFREMLDALIDTSQQLITAGERIGDLEAALASARQCLIFANDALLYKDGRLSRRKAVIAAINHINAGLMAVIPREATFPQSAASDGEGLTTGGTTS